MHIRVKIKIKLCIFGRYHFRVFCLFPRTTATSSETRGHHINMVSPAETTAPRPLLSVLSRYRVLLYYLPVTYPQQATRPRLLLVALARSGLTGNIAKKETSSGPDRKSFNALVSRRLSRGSRVPYTFIQNPSCPWPVLVRGASEQKFGRLS